MAVDLSGILEVPKARLKTGVVKLENGVQVRVEMDSASITPFLLLERTPSAEPGAYMTRWSLEELEEVIRAIREAL